MIETKFIKEIVKEFQIEEFIADSLKNVGFSGSKVQKTPLGEKITIFASRPGLIVGRKGENIQKLTRSLKAKFKFENPQIEIVEVKKPNLDPKIVAERIASSLERFGLSKFKGIGHKMLADVMDSGAQGVEILISGKIPSSRARRWRFYQGYLKKSGDLAVTGIRKAYTQAQVKTGTIGIQVRIMPPDLKLPDEVKARVVDEPSVEEMQESVIKPSKSTKKAASKEGIKKEGTKAGKKEDSKKQSDVAKEKPIKEKKTDKENESKTD